MEGEQRSAPAGDGRRASTSTSPRRPLANEPLELRPRSRCGMCHASGFQAPPTVFVRKAQTKRRGLTCAGPLLNTGPPTKEETGPEQAKLSTGTNMGKKAANCRARHTLAGFQCVALAQTRLGPCLVLASSLRMSLLPDTEFQIHMPVWGKLASSIRSVPFFRYKTPSGGRLARQLRRAFFLVTASLLVRVTVVSYDQWGGRL